MHQRTRFLDQGKKSCRIQDPVTVHLCDYISRGHVRCCFKDEWTGKSRQDNGPVPFTVHGDRDPPLRRHRDRQPVTPLKSRDGHDRIGVDTGARQGQEMSNTMGKEPNSRQNVPYTWWHESCLLHIDMSHVSSCSSSTSYSLFRRTLSKNTTNTAEFSLDTMKTCFKKRHPYPRILHILWYICKWLFFLSISWSLRSQFKVSLYLVQGDRTYIYIYTTI